MRVTLLLLIAACSTTSSTPPGAQIPVETSTAVRHDHLTTIRDIAAQMGLHNGALLGGIATSETQLAQCYDEAGFGCMGPASPDCGGGPVIAGGGDGPCTDMQGGLGMFQFDSGTYAQTIATYGDAVLTTNGNTALAVNFVVERSKQDIAGVTDWRTATAWMDGVPMTAGDPVMEQWASFLACRYNGCCSTSSLCTSRADGYRDNAIAVYQEMGAAFWDTASACSGVPDGGVIDERTACYVAAGDPRFWHAETTGFGGTSEWTMTTTDAAPANYGEWRIVPGRATTLRLEVQLDGGVHGQSKTAQYTVVHGGASDVVTVDQSAAPADFVMLGDFDFAGTGDEYVALGDNTGDATSVDLYFDALRVTALDGGPLGSGSGSDGSSSSSSGCAIGGGGTGSSLLVLAFLVAMRRRRNK